MEELSVLAEGRTVGTAQITEEGLYLRFTVDCQPIAQGPCRLVGLGERGELRLGVPEPEEGRLRLSRAISRRDCAAVGRLTGLELRPPEGEREALPWQPLRGAGEFRSPWLRAHLQGAREVLCCRSAGGVLLALPLDEGRPFPWPELFCFARVLSREGRDWAVFAFDGQERPVLPGKLEGK